ncbi:MAG: hypothetical protein FWG26_09035 [Betaproteobacteria bacterium]|nr:hypothetical protein [Betaproteobacteria bacterium]
MAEQNMNTHPDRESGVFIEKNDKGIDRIAGVISTAKTYIATLHGGDPMLSLEDRASRALEKFLDTLETLCPDEETGSDRLRWTAAAYQSMRDFFEALCAADRAEPGSIPVAVLARAGAETIRWGLVNRHAPDTRLWAWLGDLFTSDYSEAVQQVRGESEAVAREYLRAIAYHAAVLDQQTLKAGFAVARLIVRLLPDLFMVREHVEGALYGVDVAQRGIPVRLAKSASFTGWWFVTAEAVDKLSEIHNSLTLGRTPDGLEHVDAKELYAAVTHLRRQWSFNPPLRRHRRYPLNARLCVVRGYEQAMNLLDDDSTEAIAVGMGTWHITDMSLGGVGAITPRSIKVNVPTAGDLVAFCPEEGTQWHIGVVRRLRTTKSHVEIGIATLSVSPELARVDDGHRQRELCVCDPVRRGGAIRLVAPAGTLENDDPIFAMGKNAVVHKLRPVGDALKGKSFDLRIYHVS